VVAFLSRGGGNGDGGVRELLCCCSAFARCFILVCAGRFWMVTAGGELPSLGCGVWSVCACTGMVEWVGARERGERVFMDAAKLAKSSSS
jgi:hypothetical protein